MLLELKLGINATCGLIAGPGLINKYFQVIKHCN